MICKSCTSHVVMALLGLATVASATVGKSFDESFARRFSPRLAAITRAEIQIEAQLKTLPSIPVDDQGGTGGCATLHSSAIPQVDSDQYAMQVTWEDRRGVDLIALVPARRYDERGIDSRYGLPREFVVELLAADGAVLLQVAHERLSDFSGIRRGHPFVYRLERSVEASALRVRALHLSADPDDASNYVHAWAEWFVFSGAVNLCSHARVSISGGVPPAAPWHWQPEFLIDQQTPLGLPEIPAPDHSQVGWLSNARSDWNAVSSLTVDLGKRVEIDSVRLLPVRRPTSDLPSGFGFPRQFRLVGINEGASEQLLAEVSRPNPGHNPVVIRFPKTAINQLRVEAIELWKQYENYPAFFALSELEVYGDEVNEALGKPARSSDGMLNLIGPGGRQWTTAALTDGYGAEGKLISVRDWLRLLDRRLQLEVARYDLLQEADSIARLWRGWLIAVSVIIGGAGAFALLVLPVRYRVRARRELLAVRERIAGDLHDEVGSNLGSIQMYADLATGRERPAEELRRIQRIAGETVSAVRDIVWLLRPNGNHRIGTTAHLRETASIMLESLQWDFAADELAWKVEFSEQTNRHLFLFFREALHNILRHADAKRVEIAAKIVERRFELWIQDDGVGISERVMGKPATLRALHQRAAALSAELEVFSAPGRGTRLELRLPSG